MTGPTIVEAAPDRDPHLAASLARAFLDDPVMAWLIPDERRRFRAMQPFYRGELAAARRKGLVLAPEGGGAAALWYPPGRWKESPLDLVRAAPMALRSFGPRLVPRAIGVLNAIEAVHPAEPHWFLSILGSEPAHQGTGAGGALIRHVTDRCDAEGIPAYLESSKEVNLSYYARFGFEVTGEIRTPRGGPMLWPMWREPRA